MARCAVSGVKNEWHEPMARSRCEFFMTPGGNMHESLPSRTSFLFCYLVCPLQLQLVCRIQHETEILVWAIAQMTRPMNYITECSGTNDAALLISTPLFVLPLEAVPQFLLSLCFCIVLSAILWLVLFCYSLRLFATAVDLSTKADFIFLYLYTFVDNLCKNKCRNIRPHAFIQ